MAGNRIDDSTSKIWREVVKGKGKPKGLKRFLSQTGAPVFQTSHQLKTKKK